MDSKEKAELYPHTKKCLKTTEGKIRKSRNISEGNRKDLLESLIKMKADGAAMHSQLSYMQRIMPIAERLGRTRFKDCTRKQMEGIFAEYRTSRGLSQVSVNKSIGCIKAFYRWLFGLSSQDSAPDCVKWMRKIAEPSGIRPEDLWTEEDLAKVVNASRSLRTKVLVSVAFESGLRPGELRSLKMKDIIFNGDVARIYSRGKMEKREGERCVPILRTYNLLKTWVESHPGKSDPESWVWSYGKEPLPENYFRRQLEFLAKKVGITKPDHPYILRHTALTKFYKNCSGQVAKKLAGHSGSSEMADVYCHLSENDMENSVRALNGAPKKSEQDETRACRKCGSVLDLGCDICGKCGLPQNSKGALEKLEFEETLMKLGRIVLKRSEQNPRLIDMLMAEKEH